MKKIKTIIKPFKLDEVKDALNNFDPKLILLYQLLIRVSVNFSIFIPNRIFTVIGMKAFLLLLMQMPIGFINRPLRIPGL